jgi:hypothetical protein
MLPKSVPWVFEEDREGLLRGGCYVRFRRQGDLPELRQSVLHIGKHPNLKPIIQDDSTIPGHKVLRLPADIPGVTVAKLGIPYYQANAARPHDRTLIAITHTPESLANQFPHPAIGVAGANHLQAIETLMHAQRPGEQTPWYMGTSWKDNDRSSGQGTGEGSFSVAGTIQKGEGQGTFVIATQNSSPYVREKLQALFGHFGPLQRIMRLTAQRADHFMMSEVEQEINNSPRIGDGEYGGTSVQINIHYSDKPFSSTIGFEQAQHHPDDEDDPCHTTMTIHITTTPYSESLYFHQCCH